MESREKEPPRFVFPPPATTAEYTPESLTPSGSHTNLPDLTTLDVGNTEFHLVELLDEQLKLKDGLASIPYFRQILGEAQGLLRLHGPYTTYAGTSVFSRAPLARDSTKEVSVKEMATSLAAAQDCMGNAQPEGPARDDFAILTRLWRTTVSILETMTRIGDLDLEALGWGVYGLCAGHVGHNSRREEEAFLSLKKRLHVALRGMPSMDAPIRKKEKDLTKLSGGSIALLTHSNREIHVTANLLLQQFRREEWRTIRWYHAIAVASRWIEHSGLDREDDHVTRSTEMEDAPPEPVFG